jgi:Fic family protein
MRGGSREDRMLCEVEVALPPLIADVDLSIPSDLSSRAEGAVRAIATLDESHGHHLASLSTLLLRAESVASSKIEHVEASLDDFARAIHGVRSNPSANSMVASTRAIDDLVRSADGGGSIEVIALLAGHAVLMADDPAERAHAGRIREVQNWIGGSDHSPRGALYVPPPPGTVAGHLDDLAEFANRLDVSALVQAAVAHAQFESIHPFTDGNGRIGRALINTILRRRGVTRRTVVPLASALVARRDDYFDALGSFRGGDAAPIIELFARSASIAARESATTADRLAAMPGVWAEQAGHPRRGSAAARLLDGLLDRAICSA